MPRRKKRTTTAPRMAAPAKQPMATRTPVLSSTIAARHVEDPPTDWSLRTEGWKVIHHGSGNSELYELGPDPGEERDLFSARPDRGMEMKQRLEASLLGAAEGVAPSRDASTVDALKALGYVE